MPPLLDITNATGYVTFENATVGSYNFHVVKQGYKTVNATIDFTGTPLLLPITLAAEATNTTSLGSVMIVVIVVAAVAVVAVVSAMTVLRRRRSSKINKLQAIQKKLESKYTS